MKDNFFTGNKSLISEFLRYALVGGVSALADMGVNFLMLFHVFEKTKDDKAYVFISVALGFLAGLIINFILSNIFVFCKKEQKEKGKSVKAFMIYALVGIIGFILTEILTVAGTFLIGESKALYLIMTCFVKGIVLIWNYLGRKIFVYKGK